MLKIECKFHYNMVRINESVRMQTEYEYFEYEINAKFRCTILMALRILQICCIDVQYSRREIKELVLRMNRQLLNHRMSRLFSYSFLRQQNLRREATIVIIKGSSLYVWQMRNRGADTVVAEHLPARWPLLLIVAS